MTIITKSDLKQIEQHGLSLDEIEKQLDIFNKGNQFSHLDAAATIGDGILALTLEEQNRLVSKYESSVDDLDVVKFVPASGLASRMFKFLHYFKKTFDPSEQTMNAYLNRNKTYKLREFIAGIERFPFFQQVNNKLLEKGIQRTPINRYRIEFIDQVIEHLSILPKGLVPFHNYRGEIVTAFEEQIYESLPYLKSNQTAKLHFTIAQKNKDIIFKNMRQFVSKISKQFDTAIEIEYSFQQPTTDTLAVDVDNQPMRCQEGQLIFRKGGHGSLLYNLNKLDADIIFIKNIDNVSKRDWHEQRAFHKKVLAGKLLLIQENCFDWIRKIDAGNANRKDLEHFLTNELNLSHLLEIDNAQFFDTCKKALHRPIRVCGMVKNEGEPGGGPFWVQKQGKKYLQIVESSQVNMKEKDQKKIFYSGSHFNPVDLVCGVRDYKGQKFDLTGFSDPNSFFIAKKSIKGTPIKALEHPGLWNGSMALWNTLFVEVPIFTFTPVKFSNELLRPGHQVF